ncbi:bifunctional diaminohydroxyphosphoribosylaminopyrimidine deaminase/5-amino-6-(5-phosphoribosylamino)uracil reductase RibD [Qipengyuania sp. ASV99]|uniref:bifunctional diaminohydroxyphosphoribosylaminopyrimidine deaminase/5-amino-6-(5-phosphoribosylamino)uracil reductase RibD n=1 Tax=Qipengyuania sp. ASV99 TaxID=3399681 RepID=UPI003A4C73E6
MAATARLAARARPLSRPNPGVAAMLVKDGRVIARGWTQAGGRPHAEALALAGVAPGGAAGAVLFVTLEPCAHQSPRGAACTDLVIAARPARVVIGQLDPDPRTAGQGARRIERAGIAVSVLDDDASRASLAGYLTRAALGRPRVTLKLALSLDGCIAMADGSSQWITGAEARAQVHSQRARNDAILVGGSTWRADRPRLDVRLPGLEHRSPQRVLLTRGIPPDGVRVINRPDQIAAIPDALHLYVEGGAGAAASFLRQDLVDEIHLYRAPILIGGGQQGLGDIGLADLAAAHGRWRLAERRLLGSDEFSAYLRCRQLPGR